MSLIRFAAQKRDALGCDQAWCVVDVDDAVERARTRCEALGTEHTRNPSTGVWALVLQVT